MVNQIFKKQFDSNKLFTILEMICNKNDHNYVYNNEAYKKGIYFNILKPFLHECVEYYHVSKRIYVTKHLTYNSFTTVVRQICKFNKIAYTSKIKYDKSNYDIIYCINRHVV